MINSNGTFVQKIPECMKLCILYFMSVSRFADVEQLEFVIFGPKIEVRSHVGM